MEIFTRNREHGRCRCGCEDGLLAIWFVADSSRGVNFKHGDVHVVAPLAAYPSGVDGGRKGVRVVAEDVCAPDRATGADLFALDFA